jgi:predicted nucleic acid-binding protein
LTVWGTLKILLEAKAQELTQQIAPLVDRLKETGMWISDEIHQRILKIAGEIS